MPNPLIQPYGLNLRFNQTPLLHRTQHGSFHARYHSRVAACADPRTVLYHSSSPIYPDRQRFCMHARLSRRCRLLLLAYPAETSEIVRRLSILRRRLDGIFLSRMAAAFMDCGCGIMSCDIPIATLTRVRASESCKQIVSCDIGRELQLACPPLTEGHSLVAAASGRCENDLPLPHGTTRESQK